MTDVNIEEMDFETFLKNNVELESFDAKAVLLADRKQMLEEMQRQAEQEAVETAETARQTKLDSAITKLKALGLTESEAKIIIGLE